jgi:hypothetical protein
MRTPRKCDVGVPLRARALRKVIDRMKPDARPQRGLGFPRAGEARLATPPGGHSDRRQRQACGTIGVGLRRQPASPTTVAVAVVVATLLSATGQPPSARADASVAAPAATTSATAHGDGVIVPVWALLDGDTPVSGARVRVYAAGPGDHGRRSLRQLGGARLARTQESGIAMLEFDRLPRSFTVVVSGGRAEGRLLRGSLSAQVRAYRSGTVVHVTPVTTLVERWRRDDPGVNRARARVSVYRALGIPRWADDIDLRVTDRWFDGDTFLARERGRLDRAIPELLDEIRNGAEVRFQGTPPEPSGAALAAGNPIEEWWKNADVTKLVTSGFQDLGLSLAKQGLQAGGKWLLGKLLDEWGLKDLKDVLLPKSDTEVIREILDSINKRVVEVQISVESVKQAVAESQYSQLVAETNKQTAAIDKITEELAVVARMAKEDKTRVNYSQTVIEKIKKLDDDHVSATLNKALDNPVRLANDILKAASQVMGTRRFFTSQSWSTVYSVYEYFALYQFRLAILLTNYWSTKPDTFSQATIKTSIDGINNNIVKQRTDRILPSPTSEWFVDTRNMKKWSTKPRWVNSRNYAPRQTCRPAGKGTWSCSEPLDPNWRAAAADLPTEEDFRQLIDGWDGNNPFEWLRRQVGRTNILINPNLGDQIGFMWLGPEPVSPMRSEFTFKGLGCHQTFARVNLRATDRPGPRVVRDREGCSNPGRYSASAMIVRTVSPGDFWWPIGGR